MTYNTENWKRKNNKDMDYNNSSRRFRPLGSNATPQPYELSHVRNEFSQPAKTAVSPRSSPPADVSREGTCATQLQKFHTDDVNQCLQNKSGSHGVPSANLFNFTFFLVDFGKVWCSSANERQQNSNASAREKYIPQILTVLLQIHRVYI